MLLNADWGFFAPLRLCVIFALKKISLAEVFGYAPVKILNKTLASRLWRLEPPRKLHPLISGSKTEFFNAETRRHRDAEKPQSELKSVSRIENQLKKMGFLCVSASQRLRVKKNFA